MSEPQEQPRPDEAGDAGPGWSWGAQDGVTPGYGPPVPPAAPPVPPSGVPQPGQSAYGQPEYGAPRYGQPPYGAPQYGQPPYDQPEYGAPRYGQPSYGAPQYGAPAGYAPAPLQRGIVPLRPLSLGEIYDGAFRAIRANPRVMFGFSAIVVGVAAVVGGLAWWLVIPSVSALIDSNLPPELSVDGGDELFAAAYSMYAMIPFLFLAGVALTGVLTVSVSRSVIGQKIDVGDLWRDYWKRVLLVGAYTLLQGLAAGTVVVLFALLVAAAAAASGALAGVVGVVGGLGLVVLFVWATIRLIFVPPVLMLERRPLFPSIARAWRVTRGSFWRILGISLLAQVIAQVVSQVLTVPTSIIGMLIAGTDGNGLASGGYIATMTIGMAVAYTIPAIFLAAVVALLYIDVRIRKEGLDVQLARAAEATAAKVG